MCLKSEIKNQIAMSGITFKIKLCSGSDKGSIGGLGASDGCTIARAVKSNWQEI